MRETRTAPGFKEVLVPGDLEFRNQAKIDLEGLPIDASLNEQLKQLSIQQNVAFPASLT
jgi:LDH2 family malate/lactate/ureidoglycolate dehydrogenase